LVESHLKLRRLHLEKRRGTGKGLARCRREAIRRITAITGIEESVCAAL